MNDQPSVTLRNPQNGALVEAFPSQGKKWTIKPGETWAFPVNVANDLVKIYGFLEKVNLDELSSTKKYSCSLGDFSADAKIAVLGHMRKHKEKVEVVVSGTKAEVQMAIPVGEAVARPTIAEERANRFSPDLPIGKDKDGVEWYGDTGMVEQKPASRNIKGTPGHFGAA